MKNRMVEKLNLVLGAQGDDFKQDETLEPFEKTIQEFDALVEKGLASKRGHHAFPKPDLIFQHTEFNRERRKTRVW